MEDLPELNLPQHPTRPLGHYKKSAETFGLEHVQNIKSSEYTDHSVCQIHCHRVGTNYLQPWLRGSTGDACGSGFVTPVATMINNKKVYKNYIITNHHVISDSKKTTVTFPAYGNKHFQTRLVADCPQRDLAILRIQNRYKDVTLKPLTLGDSDALENGCKLQAVGYPLGMNSCKITEGVKAGNQVLHGTEYIQNTCPLNPGNSGGALLFQKDEKHAPLVVGVNNAIIPGKNSVGFSIPSSHVKVFLKDYLTSLKEKGHSRETVFVTKPFLGFSTAPADDARTELLNNKEVLKENNMFVNHVIKDSIGDNGLQKGDQIVEINGISVDSYGQIKAPWTNNPVSMNRILERLRLNDTVKFKVARNGELVNTELKISNEDPRNIKPMYSGYQKQEFKVIGGMNVSQLNLNLAGIFARVNPNIIKYLQLDNMSEKRIVVTHVFDGTHISSLGVQRSLIVSHVNEHNIETISDIENAIQEAEDIIQIEFENGSDIVIKKQDLMDDIETVKCDFNIRDKYVMDIVMDNDIESVQSKVNEVVEDKVVEDACSDNKPEEIVEDACSANKPEELVEEPKDICDSEEESVIEPKEHVMDELEIAYLKQKLPLYMLQEMGIEV